MQIYTSFAEADIGGIKVGQPVRFNVDAPEPPVQGQRQQLRLNLTTTQNVVTYNVVVEVENPDQRAAAEDDRLRQYRRRAPQGSS